MLAGLWSEELDDGCGEGGNEAAVSGVCSGIPLLARKPIVHNVQFRAIRGGFQDHKKFFRGYR